MIGRRGVLRGVIAVVGLGTAGVGGLVGYVKLAPKPRFEIAAPEIRASSDPAVIAQGAYLVHAVAYCSDCHAPKGTTEAEPALAGGDVISTPFGDFWPPNVTPDSTGIAAWSDDELARVIRHAVDRDGHVSPFMKVALGPMSDADLTAIVSYLRTTAPVEQVSPASAPNLVGEALATFAFAPAYREIPPYVAASEEPSVARGRYLAEGPAGCYGCHTDTDLFDDLAPLNAPFSGGRPHELATDPPMEVVPPNLTPDPTGVLGRWDEPGFVARFRQGTAYPDSIMPWRNYAQLTDADLRSLYRFLSSLEPVRNETGPSYRAAGWTPEP